MRSRVLAMLVVMVVVSLLAPVYAGTLAVPLIGQEEDNWCWDASSNMILRFYGFTHTETEVADWAVGGYNVGNHLSSTTVGPLAVPGDPNSTYNRKGCGLVLTQFGPVDSSYLARALTMDEVSEEIDGKRPAMIAIRWIKAGKDVGGHAIVLRGYDESVDEMISLNDPWPADNNVHGAGTPGASYEVAYDDMFSTAGTYSDASAVIGNRWAQTLKTGRSLDLCFLIDTTGSMQDDIDSVKTASLAMIDYLAANYKDLRLAVVDYKDNPDCESCDTDPTVDYITHVDTVWTADANVAKAAINNLPPADGGGDLPEAVFSALVRTMSGSEIGDWRKDAERHIILMGDAPGHDPEPWDGGYSYADVLAIWAAEPNKIAIDALLPQAGGEYDEDASAQFSGLAAATGGSMQSATDSNTGVAMLEIVNEITTTPRSPRASIAAFKPVFTFIPPTESMGPLVKNILLEIQKWNVNTKDPNKSVWKKYMLVKLADPNATSWTPPKPLPQGDYQWRVGYVRGAGTFMLPSGETRKVAAATLMEPNWTAFTREEVVPATPTLVSPYSSFTATDKEQDFIFDTVVGADAYALGISAQQPKTGTWKLWKKLTVKPSAADPNTGTITVTVKGLTLNGSYEWSVQALNYDNPKPVY
ncbi:MAG: C39 family peptidase [Sedimentisphaerales bacterium]